MNLVTFLVATPSVAVVVLLGTFYLRRARWTRRRRTTPEYAGFYPSASSLGNALHSLQIFTRPTIAHVLQEKYDEDMEDDGDGGPDDPTRQLKRQLKRIRRGERVDTLTVRLRQH
jgi:hypothetical protein